MGRTKCITYRVLEVRINESPSISTKDPVIIRFESKGKKIHYSGPLVVPSGNVDQILKDHDRQVQEAVRRARIDKARFRKMQAERSQPSTTNHLGIRYWPLKLSKYYQCKAWRVVKKLVFLAPGVRITNSFPIGRNQFFLYRETTNLVANLIY